MAAAPFGGLEYAVAQTFQRVRLIDELIYFESLNLRRKIIATSTTNVSRLIICGLEYGLKDWRSSSVDQRAGFGRI